jgi:glycosyltransferase involved in cell wall biosynthesis
MKDRVLFIAWAAHNRRSQLLAEKFHIPLHLVFSLKRRFYLAPLRYVLQTIKTFIVLFRDKPDVVFVQNPPIFSVLSVYLYSRLYDAKYIIDDHSAALFGARWRWSLPVHAFLSRRAITTIVTNEYLEAIVKRWRAKTYIVADIPTVFPEGKPFTVNGKFNIAVINTFSSDEPLGEVLKAATFLHDVEFYVTGDPSRAKKEIFRNVPENLSFTGFLPDEDYFGLLRAVDAIMVLTTRNHTMQRGACEAVSLGKPIITSDWPLLRTYFNKGTVHVDNSSEDIQKGVLRVLDQKEKLEREILALQKERWREWKAKKTQLYDLIESG